MKLYESASVFGLALVALAHDGAKRAPPEREAPAAEPHRAPGRVRGSPDRRFRKVRRRDHVAVAPPCEEQSPPSTAVCRTTPDAT
jgi:hypothetical protein